MLLRRFGLRLRAACRRDKASYLSRLSDEVSAAPVGELHQAVNRVLRPRKFRKTKADPLPTLRKLDGTLCQNADEVAETWREHFRVLEGGVQVSPSTLVLRCRQAQAGADRPDTLSVGDLPSWHVLERAFRHSAPRKSDGP